MAKRIKKKSKQKNLKNPDKRSQQFKNIERKINKLLGKVSKW